MTRTKHDGAQIPLLADSPAARAADPSTSHDAAEGVTRTGHRGTEQLRTLGAVERHANCTSLELARRARIDRHTVARRLPELRDAGYVETGAPRLCTASDSGRRALTWHLTLKGAERLRQYRQTGETDQ